MTKKASTKTVTRHLQAAMVGVAFCLPNNKSGKLNTTADREAVTCKRCLRAMKTEAKPAPVALVPAPAPVPSFELLAQLNNTPVIPAQIIEAAEVIEAPADPSPYQAAQGSRERTRTVTREVCGCALGGCEHTHQISADQVSPEHLPVVQNAAAQGPAIIDEWSQDHGWVQTLRPTASMYRGLMACYDFFNVVFFNNELPDCMITLHQRKKTMGYFSAARWQGRHGEQGEKRDQITINPHYFDNVENPEREALQTLAHEMCHQWRYHYVFPTTGETNPSRAGYHDNLWALKMLAIGLQPIAVDSEGHPIMDKKTGGYKITGQRVSDKVITGSLFDQASRFLIEKGFVLEWTDAANENPNKPKQKNKSNRDKYTCPLCDTAVWGKPGLLPLCGDCYKAAAERNPKFHAKMMELIEPFIMVNADGSNIPGADDEREAANQNASEEEDAAAA